MTTPPKTTWTTAWAVHYDGSRLNEFRVLLHDRTVLVRHVSETTGGGRHDLSFYETQFGATRREAIEKFRRRVEHEVALAQEELTATQALLARAHALAAEEPQEVTH